LPAQNARQTGQSGFDEFEESGLAARFAGKMPALHDARLPYLNRT